MVIVVGQTVEVLLKTWENMKVNWVSLVQNSAARSIVFERNRNSVEIASTSQQKIKLLSTALETSSERWKHRAADFELRFARKAPENEKEC